MWVSLHGWLTGYFVHFLLCSDGEHSPIHREVSFIVNALAPIATPELIGAARDLILPVCMGVSRPFPPSFVADRFKVADEVFSLPPADLSRQRKETNPFGICHIVQSAPHALTHTANVFVLQVRLCLITAATLVLWWTEGLMPVTRTVMLGSRKRCTL